MATEIERKFLVVGDSWKRHAGPGRAIRQGHLHRNDKKSVRIRVDGDSACITVKGKRRGFSRPEFEYEIPLRDAAEMLASLCKQPVLEKTRYDVVEGGLNWEVDVFSNPPGLIIAEIELASADQAIDLPDWIGPEVTCDPRYRSSAIAHSAPFFFADGNDRLPFPVN